MDTMLFWHGVIVECGVALGLEAALLLGLAVLTERPRAERFAAALPVAGNVLAFTLARGVQASADEWQRIQAFQISHYGPSYWSFFNRENAQPLANAIVAAQSAGIVMLVLTEVLLAFGALCILMWLRPPSWLARLTRGRMPAAAETVATRETVAAAEAVAAQPAADEGDALEIWVESLER